jgi:uncharacterized protein (TIGR03435 family)
MCRILAGGLVTTTLCALTALPADGQSARSSDQQVRAFEVASVKPNTSASPASSIGFEPGGRFRAVNEPLVRLIQEAFATPATPRPQIVGAPGWVESDRFDVEAVAPDDPSQERRQAMLRAMLADRFRLASHVETRALAVYNLVRASRDAKLGDKLRVSDGACDALRKPGAPIPTPEQLRPCRLAFTRGSLRVNGVTASQFATAGLTRVVDRPVIDRTGLGATLYDWAIEWTPDPSSQVSTATDLPSSVFSAVQEQLGLKLQPATGSVDVVVVEHVDKPTLD